MLNIKEIIRRYKNNIEIWEHISDLKEWEKDYILGQRHACEKILSCIEDDEIPIEWPQKSLEHQHIISNYHALGLR